MSTIINATTTNGVVIQPDNSGSLVLQTNSGTTAVTIDTSQNVGIGTTSPTEKLQVSGNISQTGGGYLAQTNGTNTVYWTLNPFTIANSFGVGTSQSIPFIIGNNNTERMRITSTGNVGIGTASPGTALDVSGSIRTSGSLTFGTGGNYQAGSIYADSNFGIILRPATASPAVAQLRLINSADTSTLFEISSSGGLFLYNSTAQKTTGTTWSNPSDQRLKENIRDYTKGTTELMQVRVREWEYNGKGGTTEGLKGLGVVADEVMTVLPNTVETYDAKLNADDEETTEIKKFDATEITWLLVKTVQEQQTIINDLKARIETLEAK